MRKIVDVISAAKDNGDAKNDKARRSKIDDLVKEATTLLENMPAGVFPEVEDAAKTVRELQSVLARMDETMTALKAAPAGSTEAVEAQSLLDQSRVAIDAMLPVLQATMAGMTMLLAAALELEEQFRSHSDAMKAAEASLKREKQRLAAAAQAVKNATKIG